MKKNKSAIMLQTALFVPILLIMALSLSGISCTKGTSVSPGEGYYTCSMHPQVIRQEPGDCPICGMKLVFVPIANTKDEKKPTGHEGDTHFKFSLAQSLLRNANVNTTPALLESFTRGGEYSGHVDYNEYPDRLVIITTKYDGWIERLYVSKEGQWINRGGLLMAVYSQKILAAKEEFITTYQSLKSLYLSQGKGPEEFKNDSTLIASKKKLLYLDVPASQIADMEKTGKSDRLTYFRSPISGVLVKKEVLQGSYIKEGQELFRIADLRNLWIFIHIFEKDIQFVKKGQRVSINTEAYPDKTFTGVIDLIYPYIDMETRDLRVRISVGNDKLLLKPGMYVKVEIASKMPREVITIPELAVLYSGDKNYVFVSLGRGKFEIRPVTVMTRSDGKAVINDGLKEKEMVVTNGQFLLDSEASLKEALEKNTMAEHQH